MPDGQGKTPALVVPLTALVAVLLATTACGPKVARRMMDATALRQPAAWFVTFRYDADAAISGVPGDDGQPTTIAWPGRSDAEQLVRSEIAYLLAIEHGATIVRTRAEADGIVAIAPTGRLGLLVEQIRRLDIYLMDVSNDRTFAQLTIENSLWSPKEPAELARVAAAEIAALLRVP